MPTRDIRPVSFEQPGNSLAHARPLPLLARLAFARRLRRWRLEPPSGRALHRPARRVARRIERAALRTGRCTGQIYPKCHRALRSFATDERTAERTALGAAHDLHPSSLPTSRRIISRDPGSLLEARTMGALLGTRWRLWLALLGTLVLTSCVE